MERPWLVRSSWAVLLLLALALLAGCGDGVDHDAEARVIQRTAERLWQEGRLLDALKEYDKLAAHPKTAVYAEAKKKLEKEGYSLGAGFQSFAIKQMFQIKQDLVDSGRQRHPDGGVTMELAAKDPWGTPYWVQYDGVKYEFQVQSAGPDQIFRTDDDLSLVHSGSIAKPKAMDLKTAKEKGLLPGSKPKPKEPEPTIAPGSQLPADLYPPIRKPAPDPKVPERIPDRAGTKPMDSPSPDKKPPKPAEGVVDLNDLLNRK